MKGEHRAPRATTSNLKNDIQSFCARCQLTIFCLVVRKVKERGVKLKGYPPFKQNIKGKN